MRTYKTVAISMPPELYDEIADRAGQMGLTVSAYIRLCIYKCSKDVTASAYGMTCEEVIDDGRED